MVRALELKSAFSEVMRKRPTKYKELTPDTARSVLLSFKAKDGEILQMCADYLEYYSRSDIQGKTQ